MQTENYFENLAKIVKAEYMVAESARVKNIDPVGRVEIPLAMSLAEKAVGLVSTLYPQLGEDVGRNITKRILELEKEYGQLDIAVSFKIAEELSKEKFCKFESLLQAIDAGIRVGFAYITLGVVSSPIEGFTGIKIKQRLDGKEYFSAYFSGPIRSAGTTASCVVLMLIDYLRELFGYEKYDATDQEIKRYVTENYDYHERVNNLQYLPTEEEIVFLAKNIPIQIDGDPTEDKEVSNYKDLSRIETNFIRGGMCLCFSEGLAQKATKGWRLLSGFKERSFSSTGWDFLPEYIELHRKRASGTKDTSATYIKDLVAGRPVFGHPSRSGGFRFRYGRSRTSGFSAVSIHPATMFISNNFLSNGTQLKIEKPTKGCIITSCDSIDGPIIRLKDGSVKKIQNLEEVKNIYKDISQILYLGDILFPLGDVVNRNVELPMAGYVEEWWKLELDEKLKISEENIIVDEYNIQLNQAKYISEKYKISLHPSFIFYWTEINSEEFNFLLEWLQCAIWNNGLVLPFDFNVREKFKEAKRALEILGVEHDVFLDKVIIPNGEAFLANLGLDINSDFKLCFKKILEENIGKKSVLEVVNSCSLFVIKNKAGDFIGSRMGRPEKAKLRKLTGSPNVLFPVGEQGGRFRSINDALDVGYIKSDFPIFFCEKCRVITINNFCEKCGNITKRRYYCYACEEIQLHEQCPIHGENKKYYNRKVEVKDMFELEFKKMGLTKENLPELIKGIKGTNSEWHDFESVSKGVLRSKYNLAVNKDGTIRYDATEIPITHFKPVEISVSVEKLISLGYLQDIYGKKLEKEDQILNLMPHDIILPCCPETKDERADDVFFNIANFLDELLEKVYGLPRHYNLKFKEDLVGQMVVCMAPHNCAGVVGRIIGFSKLQGLLASPFMHAAMRRDCDGDEASIMMLLDVLINFSRKFLPSHRGGTQDAPLVLNAHIRAGEVDDQILDFESCSSYPLELYKFSEQRRHSSEVKIDTVKTLLREGKDPFVDIGFTHNCSNFNTGVFNSSYKVLPTMKEKVEQQMDLVDKLRAVDASDVARLILERHFIRDIRGNLRKFSHQQFRCSNCNEKFRRPPLMGVCTKCGGKIIFTISEGSIRKYLEIALFLANKYTIPDYTKQSLELVELYVESVFGKLEDKNKLNI